MSRRIVLLQALASGPTELQRLLAELPAAMAEQHLGESWAPAEVVRHLVDVESRYRERLQKVVREERPQLQQILPPATGYSGPESLPELLQQFRRTRQETVTFLTSIPTQAWHSDAVHPSWGPCSFFYLVQQLVNHDREHINQVETLKARLMPGKQTGQTPSPPLKKQEEGKHEQ